MHNTSKYENIRADLDTGDIVLFSGNGPISRGIQLFTMSEWSHIGVVIRSTEWDSVLLWESTTLSKLEDAIDGVYKQGVQTVLLSDRIRTYEGDVAVRKLNVKLTPTMLKSMRDFRKESKNKPYEESKLELISSALDIFNNDDGDEDLSSLFCSELVAELYQRMGLLSEEKPSNEYTPVDFAGKRNLELLKGELGPEIRL